MNLWYGYKHVNGTYQAKRYFDRQDIVEARESDFVHSVTPPFEAGDRKEALAEIKKRLK